MPRSFILQEIEKYKNFWLSPHLAATKAKWKDTKEVADRFTQFVETQPLCFHRENTYGHVTGSAFIVSQCLNFVLLTHHAKLKKWMQLGGHSDGDPNTALVALKEGQEESGLNSLRPLPFCAEHPDCFSSLLDLDIHSIPRRGEEPEHLHFDARFIFLANKDEPLQVSSESIDLKWISLESLPSISSEESVLRMAEKFKILRKLNLIDMH